MAYIYAADTYCDDCGDDIICRVRDELWAKRDSAVCPDGTAVAEFDDLDELDDYLRCMDETHYDSDEFPKGCNRSAEADSPQHCGSHDDCINAIELSDGHRIGVWLENDLTTDGNDYVVEAVREAREGGGNCEVADLWEEYYSYLDFSVTVACNGCGEDFDPDDLDGDNLCADCRECDDERDEWECPVCHDIVDVAADDYVEIGIPYCADCDAERVRL